MGSVLHIYSSQEQGPFLGMQDHVHDGGWRGKSAEPGFSWSLKLTASRWLKHEHAQSKDNLDFDWILDVMVQILNYLEEIHGAGGGEALLLLDPSPPCLIVAKMLAQTQGSDLPGTT